jgi:dCMP deaminase
MTRPSKDVYFMSMAELVATRSECPRRSVGCVIVDARGRVLSTGFNGLAPGRTSCIEKPCPGAHYKSGYGLDECQSSHSEVSALVTLDKPFLADTIYVTTAPCISCTKAILLTSIKRIVFKHPYSSSGEHLWANPDTWIQL